MPLDTHGLYQFAQALEEFEPLEEVFNPWRQVDPEHDNAQDAPATRRFNLCSYLAERIGHAKVVLVGEAPGFNGCKFSGIAMTSERILLSNHPKIRSEWVFSARKSRTSKEGLNPMGMAEPTASIAWDQMIQAGFLPREFAIWNAFAFHPHKPGNSLSNRAPTAHELHANLHILKSFLGLFPGSEVIAVGNVAQRTLSSMGVEAKAVRHPAMGGATMFRSQMSALLQKDDSR